MKTIKMPIDRKERILNMFVRTIISYLNTFFNKK